MTSRKCVRAAPAIAVRDPRKFDEISRPVDLQHNETYRSVQRLFVARRGVTPALAEIVAYLLFGESRA